MLCFIYLGLISQHTVSVFYLQSSIPCITILTKDNTIIVFIWSSSLRLHVHDGHYAKKAPDFLRIFELFDGIVPEQAVLFSFLAFKYLFFSTQCISKVT